MKVLILGSGGREHALAWRLSRDSAVGEIITAPGNPGAALVGRTMPVDLDAPEAMLALAREQAVDLTVVGPEAPLEKGVADLFRRHGLPIVGPSSRGAALECSKAYAKALMIRRGIPTARSVVCDSLEGARAAVSGATFGFPVVVKADGLAGGKGVTIAMNRDDAEGAIRAAMVERRFGAAGTRLVIEEYLTGPEVSMFYLLDGARAISIGSAQDHKRVGEGDSGPNTGGMGAFAPSPLVTLEREKDVADRIVRPILEEYQANGDPYIGFLYVSLMLTPDGPRVIEFNVRFGDPEAQAMMPLLGNGFAPLLLAAANGALPSATPPSIAARTVAIALASRGYPASSENGREITGLEDAAAVPGVTVFHAGTREVGGRIVTAGGRVLTVVARRNTFRRAMDAAYDAASLIHFDGMQYRRDIGLKAIEGRS